MDLIAITAQLAVVDGTVQSKGDVSGLLAQPAPAKAARGRERDFLFAHLTLSDSTGESAPLIEDLITQFAADFFQSTGSVTSSLRRAVIATNERLLKFNLDPRKPSGSVIWEGALTCAALHNDELFTLQVGEGLAFVGHQFGVERLPPQLPAHLTPLGRTAGIDIRFAYHRLQNGDMMLLGDPRLGHLTGVMLAPVLVNTEIESGLESLMELVADETARLLLVEFADELPSTLPLTFTHSKQPPKAAAKSRPVADPSPRPTTTSQIIPPSPVPRPHQPETSTPYHQAEDEPKYEQPYAAASDAVSSSARRLASDSARGLSRATRGLASLLGLLTSPSARAEEAETPVVPPVHWAIPATVALLIPVILGAIVAGIYFRRSNLEQLSVIKEEMIVLLGAAEAAADNPDDARLRFGQVLTLADRAVALETGDPEIARMRESALSGLDLLDGVTRWTATPFYRYDDNVNLSRIILTGDSNQLAVIDQTSGRVLSHPIDNGSLGLSAAEPAVLVYPTQAVGALVVGSPIDLLWIPSVGESPRDSVAIIDRTGGLFNYFTNLKDIRGITLDNSAAWLTPTSAATYVGRLYILDQGAEQIWKYYPADTGFNQQEADPIISFGNTMDLGLAVDFDIYAEDGGIVVIYRDGQVRYYDSRSGRVEWDEESQAANWNTTPIVEPVSVDISGRGLTSSIYILDQGNSRLIQMSRSGQLLAQYRLLDAAGTDILGQATDFAVSESPLRVYITAGNTIYVAGPP